MQKDLPEVLEGGDPPCWAHLFDEHGGDGTPAPPDETEIDSRTDSAEEATHNAVQH